MSLTQQEISEAQSILTNQNEAAFYAYLASKGESYGDLGQSVTNNDGWQGELANGFAASGDDDDSVDVSHGSGAWEDLNAQLAVRHLQAYIANGGGTPTMEQIQTYHNEEYVAAGLDEDDWFPNQMLNQSSDPEALWADWQSNQNPLDIWEDAIAVARAGGALPLPPYFMAQALLYPDSLPPGFDFAQNLFDALSNLSPEARESLINDLLGNLPADYGWGWENPGSIFNELLGLLPSWIQGALDPFDNAEDAVSPLVLDLDGNGIELAEMNETGSVYWDIDEDGFAEASGWISGGDGLLAIDLNEDGFINDHSELFGNQSGSPNGFTTLATYDSNTDGYITSADTQFGDLLVWVDTNADGYSQEGELHTLGDLTITSIDLGYSNVSYTVAGNEIRQESTFTINGNTRDIVDAWFAYDDVNTVYAQDYTLDVRTLFLPTLRGYGELPSLHIAMSLDNTGEGNLLSLVKDLATQDAEALFNPETNIFGAVRDILHRWAGSDAIDPESRGQYANAQDLNLLEKIAGRDYLQNGDNPNPNIVASYLLQQSFDAAYDALSLRLLMQTAMSEIFSVKPLYNPVTDELDGSYELDTGRIEEIVIANDLEDEDLAMLWFNILNFIERTAGLDNLTVTEEGDLDTLIDDTTSSAFDYAFFYDAVTSTSSSSTGDSGDNILFGTESVTSLSGNGGHDVLVTGPYGTQMYGNAGDDTYIVTTDFGSALTNTSTINEDVSEGTDTIRLIGNIAPEEVRMWIGEYGNLYLQIGEGNPNDRLTVVVYTDTSSGAGSDIGSRIEQIVFSDSTTWNLTNGTVQKDTNLSHYMHGTTYADTMYGNGGDDSIYGYNGNDYLIGGDGVDYLYGGAGSDTLEGSAGVDYLDGQAGNDTFVWNIGDGNDSIEDTDGTADVLELGEGITINDVRFFTNGNDLQLFIGSEVITLEQQLYDAHNSTSYYGEVETLLLADTTTIDLINNLTLTGTSASESVYGINNNNTLIGLEGDDTLLGADGNDTYVWSIGDGNDFIIDSAGTDKVQFGTGITANDLRFFYGTSYGLEIYVGSEKITLDYQLYDIHNGTNYYAEVESALFSNSTTLDLVNNLNFTGTSAGEAVYGVSDNNTLKGLGGNDDLYGYDGDDILYGGSGTDTLTGGSDEDTFAWLANDIDGSLDAIHDFSVSGGDKINVSDVLDDAGYDPLYDLLSDYLQITEDSSHTTFWVDVTGTGTFGSDTDFVVLNYVTDILPGGSSSVSTGTDLQNLITAGTLVV